VKQLVVVTPRDNVATALVDFAAGTAVPIATREVIVVERIPAGHKLALIDIAAGDPVVKYGVPVGTATRAIRACQHVHVHNLSSTRGRGDRGLGSEGGRERTRV